ncbi:MAG: hypothetical protein GY789_12925 [Hyphomicrobiales bacterium]|nr:hypothetical protein [Hyphomicrobiales bacterium]MCP4999420.1 hypothetical protein [Hyphomicrobiales bacterium]
MKRSRPRSTAARVGSVWKFSSVAMIADAIRGRARYPYTSQEMVHNIEVLEAIARSAEEG